MSNIITRTTSTPASLPSSPRDSTCPSKSSSPSPCARSSNGPSSPSMQTGSSEELNLLKENRRKGASSTVHSILVSRLVFCVFISFYFTTTTTVAVGRWDKRPYSIALLLLTDWIGWIGFFVLFDACFSIALFTFLYLLPTLL